MMHNGDVSFYPKAGMFRLGRSLCNARNNQYDDRFWRELATSSPLLAFRRGRYIHYRLLKIVHAPGLEASVIITPTIGAITPVVHVWRIQRAVRRFLKLRLEQKAFAVTMCYHKRLGSGSCAIACLPPDVLHDVLHLVLENKTIESVATVHQE